MTKEEFGKIPFKFVGHISMEGEHQRSYTNEQFGFNICVVTKSYNEGMMFGRSRRWYQYKGKWYGTLKKFLEAIKDVEFINNI